MHTSLLRLAVPAAAAMALGSAVALAPSAFAEDLECRGTLGAITVAGTVLVPDDATCTLNGTYVMGSVVVKSRATLVANGVELTGTVAGEGPKTVEVRNSEIGNGFSISKAEPNGQIVLAGSSVTGDIQLADDRGPAELSNNQVGGSIQANKNTGGLTITGNRIVNGLQCQDNRPAPVGGGNVAAQKQGQCLNL